MRVQFLQIVKLGLLGGAFAWPMVGWDAYQSYDLSTFRPGEVTRQFSSYDRANGNDDGFDGTYSCLRIDSSGRCVIAEATGPGEIASIWFTYAVDTVSAIGNIQITLDSQLVMNGDLQTIVSSGTGSPFVWPFVGNTIDTNGGNVIKVPMAYQKSMQITVQNNPHFYHVVYRTFPSDTQVSTFDPKQDVASILTAFKAFGAKDPKSTSAGGSIKHSTVSVSDGASSSVSLANTCGTVNQLQLRIPELPAGTDVTDDGRAFGSGGGESFILKLDKNNAQCTLTRRIDATIANQVITVSVDGQAAGQMTNRAALNQTFQDVVLNLPSATTNGKTQITVKTTFVSSSLDANVFAYALHCNTSSSWADKGFGPSSDYTLMDYLDVGPSNPRWEAAHGYSITGQTWSGVRAYSYADTSHNAITSNSMLNSILISMTFDGKTTISNVPLGSLFGTSLTKMNVQSLLVAVDMMRPNGAFTLLFPMPFTTSASITVTNKWSGTITPSVDWNIGACPSGTAGTWGHFSVQHRRGQTTPGVDWPILSTTGPGIAYGHTQTFRGSILPPANDLEFLEGDLQVYVGTTTPPSNLINSTFTTMLGTGTEDFYESGWYFTDTISNQNAAPFEMPLTGLAGHVYHKTDVGCTGQCLDAHRFMIADSSAFASAAISFNIEHGPAGDNIQADYETSAYYYA